MAPDLSDPNQLAQVLSMLSANDTNTVKNGEKILKPFLKKPSCIQGLVMQITASQDVNIRHHAALLLKKKIGTHYRKHTASQQVELRAGSLGMMVAEKEKAIRTGLAGAVASLAKSVFACKQAWPELYTTLSQLAQDPNEQLREVAYNLAGQLVEQVASELKASIAAFVQMFAAGCQDPSTDVAEAALSAVSSFIRELGRESEIMQMSSLLSPMLTVMGNCLQNGNEDTVVEGLDVIQELCLLEAPLVNDYIEPIVHFAMGVLQGADYDSSVKQSAGQTLINLLECRPKLMVKKNLVGPVLSALMTMIAQQESSAAGSLFSFSKDGMLNEDEDEDEDFSPEMDVQRLSQTIIDAMAINIPSKHFVEPALTLCAQGMASPDAQMRKAGCAVLGVITEGCCDRIKETLSQILPRLLQLIQDPEYYVRECACFALGQFSEYCQPDILHHNQAVLPVLFHALDDSRPTVQGTCCYVLEYFCEGLQPETLRPYLNPLMTRLAALLQKPQRTTKEMALTAIAATAVAAEIDFLPYTETICNILGQTIFSSDEKQYTLRGRSLECLGHIAVAIGREHFAPYFETGMQSAVQGIQLNDETLKEHSFVFFANCAKVMGKGFQGYMPQLVPFLLEVIAESEIFQVGEDDDDGEAGGAGGADDDDESVGDFRLNVAEGFVNTKKAALSALGALAEHTEELFVPFLQQTMEALLAEGSGSIHSLHDTVRAEAYSILQHMVTCALVAGGIKAEPKFGELLPLNASQHSLAQAVMSAYLYCILNDDDKLPVAYAEEALTCTLKQLGAAGLQLTVQVEGGNGGTVMESLMKAVLLILSEKAPCQGSFEQADHDDDDEDDADHDHLVMDSVTDVIAVLAKILGPSFVPYFDEFQKHLMKFMKPTRSHTDRSMVIGCFAEVVMEIGPVAAKYADVLLPAIQTSLADPMEGVRRNAAFCLSAVVQSTGSTLTPQYQHLLQWLHPLCVRKASQCGSDVGGADVDNALGAVVRMINTSGAGGAVPLAQVLPVLVEALPLREDYTEGPIVHKCLADLVLQLREPTALSMVPQIVAVQGSVLVKGSNALDETKSIAVAFLKQLAASSEYSAVVSGYVNQITDAESKQLVQQLLSS